MTGANLPPDVAAYLAQVRAALADLPADDRDELLADVETSLLDVAADSVEPVATRLGPPDVFARELRAAAGLSATVAAPLPSPRRSVRDIARSLREHPRAFAARRLGGELAPIWWFLRGYVAIVTVSLLLGIRWSDTFVGVPAISVPLGGPLLVVAAIVGSIAIGLRERTGRMSGRWLVAANLALVIAAFPVAFQISDGRAFPSEAQAYYEPESSAAVVNMGSSVENIYPYSRDGELLFDVLLYDSYGQPLEVGSTDPSVDPLRRYVESAAGEPLLHAFPIRYFEPGTDRIADPLAGPEITVPKIVTKPIEPEPTAEPRAKRKRKRDG